MQKHYVITENFFEQAEEMRRQFEEHFSTPYVREGLSHQIWDYWHVPEMYTYLRTFPNRIMTKEVLGPFMKELKSWAKETLGLTTVTYPYLSIYVNGCAQGLHNDTKNGRWAYVFSLTRWDERKFLGGETLVFKEANYWESDNARNARAGTAFYRLIPAKFNQLVVFDDRMIHGVQQIQGNMNPLEGRVVFHGHIQEGGIDVEGQLTEQEVNATIEEMTPSLNRLINGYGSGYHGYVSFRLTITPHGTVEHIEKLGDRLLSISSQAKDPAQLVDDMQNFLLGLNFPSSDGRTFVIWPIVVDN